MFTFRKPAALLLAASMLFSLCCCSEEDRKSLEGYHFHWMDSAIFENIDQMKTKSAKDDFAAFVNYEWAKEQKEDYTYSISAFGEVMRQVVVNKRAILNDKSVQNKNVELLRIADGIFNDWNYRNAQGVEPLKKYISYIDEIKTIDDVTSYMTDNKKNPFAFSFVEIGYYTNEALKDSRALLLNKPDLMLEEEDYYIHMTEEAYKRRDTEERRIRYVLQRCGYSDKEVNAIVNGGLGFETKLVHLDYTEEFDAATVHPMSEIIEKAGNYPLEAMLKHYNITKCDNFMGSLKYLDKLDKIYVQKNVEEMKMYFKARLALKSIRYLDQECNDFYLETRLDRTSKFAERHDKEQDAVFFEMISNSSLTAAMDQAYLDYYYDESVYLEIKDFIAQLKAKYKILINASKLKDESKKALCDKLDKIGEKVIVPDNKADFTGVEFKSKEEGGCFLDIMCETSRIKNEHIGEIVQSKIAKDFWDIYDGNYSTTVTNAQYSPVTNTIYINMGILLDPIYNHDYPMEKKLGSFVTILAHEISHAFDSGGINRDAEGRYRSLVTSEELDTWNNAATRVDDHFYGYEPFEGAGTYGSGVGNAKEAIADAEGVKACLMLGKDLQKFDYDLFFRSFATLWRFLVTKQNQVDALKTDPHPLSYIRINYTLMQFDEFYETYGIKPGDGMYMDPSERILVW